MSVESYIGSRATIIQSSDVIDTYKVLLILPHLYHHLELANTEDPRDKKRKPAALGDTTPNPANCCFNGDYVAIANKFIASKQYNLVIIVEYSQMIRMMGLEWDMLAHKIKDLFNNKVAVPGPEVDVFAHGYGVNILAFLATRVPRMRRALVLEPVFSTSPEALAITPEGPTMFPDGKIAFDLITKACDRKVKFVRVEKRGGAVSFALLDRASMNESIKGRNINLGFPRSVPTATLMDVSIHQVYCGNPGIEFYNCIEALVMKTLSE